MGQKCDGSELEEVEEAERTHCLLVTGGQAAAAVAVVGVCSYIQHSYFRPETAWKGLKLEAQKSGVCPVHRKGQVAVQVEVKDVNWSWEEKDRMTAQAVVTHAVERVCSARMTDTAAGYGLLEKP